MHALLEIRLGARAFMNSRPSQDFDSRSAASVACMVDKTWRGFSLGSNDSPEVAEPTR